MRRSHRVCLATSLPALLSCLFACGKSPAWSATVEADQTAWSPGQRLTVKVTLHANDDVYSAIADAGYPAEKCVALVTAERLFDSQGIMRFASDEGFSTLLTPTGIPIEGGIQGAITDLPIDDGGKTQRYRFKTPVNVLLEAPVAGAASFETSVTLPEDLPPGLYRLRVDLGIRSKTTYRDLNGSTFASRPFLPRLGSYAYSSLYPASGRDVSGNPIDASKIAPRVFWTLFPNDYSNGYRGVVADEDQARFALASHHLIQDEVVLPRTGVSGYAIGYSLEPGFPTDAVDAKSNLAWDFTQGELTAEITAPDQTKTVLGPTPILEKAKYGNGPTTNDKAFTAWKPPMDGRYTVKLTGWIADQDGRRYAGGGTYRFWIAKRMTMATATFQGMPYAVGGKYGRDIAFSPAVPAAVEIVGTFYPGSDASKASTQTWTGTATTGGVFLAATMSPALTFTAPGEYHARIRATYTDAAGNLWICAMRHAGIVFDPSSTAFAAHGKKVRLADDRYAERGVTKSREGYASDHLDHVAFPYHQRDVVQVASDGGGFNKIEPVLIAVKPADEGAAWDWHLDGVGKTNLYIGTSNGYSPHMFPEFINHWEYYYAAAARPGFMGRFLVGESNQRAPYWPTSPNSFGYQFGASANGDLPGDLYRLVGGIAVWDKDGSSYAGYLASAAILKKGSNANGVYAPGSIDLAGPTAEPARFFLVGYRPGMALPPATPWKPAIQVDPMVPATIKVTLVGPGGTVLNQWSGDAVDGSWAGGTPVTLTTPGVYQYQLSAAWSDGSTTHFGKMPGLPACAAVAEGAPAAEGAPVGCGEFYVYTSPRPSPQLGLIVDMPVESSFKPTDALDVTGRSSASAVHYALLMPGAVLAQGTIPVAGDGTWRHRIDPVALHAKAPIYDIHKVTDGSPAIGRVLHLSLFSEETTGSETFWDFRRVIVRGTTVVSVTAP